MSYNTKIYSYKIVVLATTMFASWACNINMVLKGYPLEAKTAQKNWNQSVHIFWARLASFCHLGMILGKL